MLTVNEVADHYGVKPATVRRWIRAGDLAAQRMCRDYRLSWESVWTCERGPMPRGARRARYQQPLMSKARLAAVSGYSTRTVERWLAEGLPTRNVFGSVRVNPCDARDWLGARFGVDLMTGAAGAGGAAC